MMYTKGAQSQLLQAFLFRPIDWRYGYELSRDTGLRHGTLYPLLLRLEASGLLESHWEQDGGRSRHMYRLTERGRMVAVEIGGALGDRELVATPPQLQR